MGTADDFGSTLLKKFGWTEGKGLGKDESGMTTYIKPALKFTNTGLGFKVSDEFTDHWWDSYYNTSSNNIKISKSEDGKVVIKSGNKSVSRKVVTKKSYSSFVSGGSLIGSKVMKSKKQKENVQFITPKKSSILLDQNEMLKIQNISCKRSAAKLSRIAEQDKKSLNKKKGVSFAKKLRSFRLFNKKKSILTDFGQLRPVKNVLKLSCLKKTSAYSPRKKMCFLQDTETLLQTNGNVFLQKGNKGKSKKKKIQVTHVVNRKNINKIVKKKHRIIQLNELSPDSMDTVHTTPTTRKEKRKLKKLKQKIKRKQRNGYQMMNGDTSVITNENSSNENSDPKVHKKIKKNWNPFVNIGSSPDTIKSDNMFLNSSANSSTQSEKDNLKQKLGKKKKIKKSLLQSKERKLGVKSLAGNFCIQEPTVGENVNIDDNMPVNVIKVNKFKKKKLLNA